MQEHRPQYDILYERIIFPINPTEGLSLTAGCCYFTLRGDGYFWSIPRTLIENPTVKARIQERARNLTVMIDGMLRQTPRLGEVKIPVPTERVYEMLFHTAIIANGPRMIFREVAACDPESGQIFYCHQKIAFDKTTIDAFCAHRFYNKLPLLDTNDILATGSPRLPMLDKIFSVLGETKIDQSNLWVSSVLILKNYQPELFEREDFIRQFTAFFVKHPECRLEMSVLIEQGLFSVERFNLIEFIASCLGNPFPAITEFLTPICNVEMPLDHKSAFVDGHLNGAMAQVVASVTDLLGKVNQDAKAPLLRAIFERKTKSEQSAQLQTENQQLRAQMRQLTEEKTALECELSPLKTQVEELRKQHRDRQNKIREVTAQAKQNEAALQLARDRLLKSGEEQKEIERMGSEIPGMRERYCALKQEFDALKQQCAESEKELKKSQEKKEKQRAQITAIDADLIKAKQGFEARQKSLADVTDKTEKLKTAIEDKAREMKQAEEYLKKMSGKSELLQNDIIQKKHESHDMQGKCDEITTQIDQETCKIRQAREQLLKAEEEQKRLKTMEETTRAQYATTQKTLSALQQQCDEAEKKCGEMSGKQQEIARTLLMAQQEITQKEADFQQTQQALEAIRKRTAQADQDLNGAAREFSVSSELPRASSQTSHSVFSEESAEQMAKTLRILHRQLCCVGGWQRYDRGEGSKRTEQLQQQTEQLRQQIEQLQQQMGTMLRRPQQTTAVAVPVIPALTQQGMRFMLPFTAPISSQSGGAISTPQQKRPGG